MIWAVDTNVLLRITDAGTATQPIAQTAIETLRLNGDSLSIFPQNLIEFCAVATRPLASNGLGLTVAQVEYQVKNLKDMFILFDNNPTYAVWEAIVSRYQITGKQVHDAHLVAGMLVNNLTHLLSFNDRDFKRFAEITVVNPQGIT